MAVARAKFDKMWRVWYAILVLALHAFLLYSAFQRYASFRAKALREGWEMSPMNFYLAMMIIAAFMLPFFMYAAFVRTGNYAEDGVQVGRDRDNLRVAVTETASGTTAATCAARLRRHFMPYTCVLHVLMAFCLLIPMPVLEAAEIQNAKRSKEEIWRTNLDFLFRPTASATNSISPEVFNLMLALAILLVRYPSSFWFSNRVFAFLFSTIMCVCSVHVVLAYEATSVLFKASVTEGAAQVNLVPPAIIALHSIGDLLLLLANIAFFEFGYAQMLANLRKYRHYLQLEASSSVSDRSSNCSDEAPCWLNYAPHLVGILLMVLAVLCKAPVLWDWVGIYRVHRHQAMLAAIGSGGFYLVLWVGVWFLFGFKSNWKFNIRLELEFPSKLGASFRQQQQQQQQGGVQRADSDAGSSSKRSGNHYIYMQGGTRGGNIEAAMSMIPTISEQVDIGSENSYTCGGVNGGGGSTLERQHSGLVKYQVRRGSVMSGASQFSGTGTGSLRRTASTASRRGGAAVCGVPASAAANSGNGSRVTFKDMHDAIPGSPNASSSDSGIDSSRMAVQLGIAADDPYARVIKPHQQQQQQQQQQMQMQQIQMQQMQMQQIQQQQQQMLSNRAPSRQSNYDDYQMFGSLFNPQQQQQQQQMVPERDYYSRQELELTSSHGDIYGRIGVGALARIPSEELFEGTYGTAGQYGAAGTASQELLAAAAAAAAAGDYRQQVGRGVPDILSIGKSPYNSLGRPALHRGSYSSLPAPPGAELAAMDHVDGLCSQV